MKLFELVLLEMLCPVCGLHICKCDSEEEEVEYKGKKITIGKHDDTTDDHYDYHELAMGIEAEKEHTNDERTAKNIAKDHLSELPDYYSRLKKMEHSTHGPESFKSYAEREKHGK
jgi:hypothetical protein